MLSIWTSPKFCLVAKSELFTTQSCLLMTLKKKPFENIVGKEKNAGDHYFLPFPNCFLAIPKIISVFKLIYFVICKSFQFRTVQNFVVW